MEDQILKTLSEILNCDKVLPWADNHYLQFPYNSLIVFDFALKLNFSIELLLKSIYAVSFGPINVSNFTTNSYRTPKIKKIPTQTFICITRQSSVCFGLSGNHKLATSYKVVAYA